jgi:hypothetical protein
MNITRNSNYLSSGTVVKVIDGGTGSGGAINQVGIVVHPAAFTREDYDGKKIKGVDHIGCTIIRTSTDYWALAPNAELRIIYEPKGDSS